MTKENLKKANDINNELQNLKTFILYASKVWTGKLTKHSFISSAFGFFESKEYFMNTRIKNKVLKVLEDYRDELEMELEKL